MGTLSASGAENAGLQLSVVIPVYNSEKYLQDCLDSLLCQNVPAESYEVVCVNDGSTDSSLRILQEYAGKHPQIKVISQENRGHCAARNTGLAAASGRYVWFMDSDDYLPANCFGALMRVFQSRSPDELLVGYAPVPEDSHFTPDSDIPEHPSLLDKRPPFSACGIRIVKRSLLTERHIVWDSHLYACEDIKYTFQVEKYAEVVLYTPDISYYHRQRSTSLGHLKNEHATRSSIASFLYLADFYHEELSDPYHGAKKKKQVLTRRNLCTETVLFSLAVLRDDSLTRQTMDTLTEKGYYPYSLIGWKLKPKLSLKRTVLDWVKFLFPVKWYYKLFYKRIAPRLTKGM